MKKVLTVTIDGIRYHASRPADCRHCFFWKNRKKGCVLGKENCYYPDRAAQRPQQVRRVPLQAGKALCAGSLLQRPDGTAGETR